MKQATRDAAQRLIAEAEKDLKDAELLLRYESYYPLCRLAYLAAEKAIRGWLAGKGLQAADQPTLASLGQQLEEAEPALEPLMTSLSPLEQFAPPASAGEPPGASSPPPLYSREVAKGALGLARQVVIEVKRALAAPS